MDNSSDMALESDTTANSSVETGVKGCHSMISATGVLTALAAAFVVMKKRKA